MITTVSTNSDSVETLIYLRPCSYIFCVVFCYEHFLFCHYFTELKTRVVFAIIRIEVLYVCLYVHIYVYASIFSLYVFQKNL